MAQSELKRQNGLFDAIMLISGDMIGHWHLRYDGSNC